MNDREMDHHPPGQARSPAGASRAFRQDRTSLGSAQIAKQRVPARLVSVSVGVTKEQAFAGKGEWGRKDGFRESDIGTPRWQFQRAIPFGYNKMDLIKTVRKEFAMVYRGHVHGGTIVFDDSVAPPEGAEVEVFVRAAPPVETVEEPPTLNERYKSFIGIASGLPSDLAEQHDHYLYGTPKRE